MLRKGQTKTTTPLRAAFVAVTVLALGLRFWHLEQTTFGADEAVLSMFAEDMVRGGAIPLSGPLSSVGLSTPAHFIYLIAPAVAISRDPLFVSSLVATIGALAVVITMLLGWRAFGPLAGLIAGLLLAVNPTAVAYSRRIWQPDLLPALAALFLLAVDLAVVSRRAWSAAASFPIAALATLMHSSFAPLAVLLLAPFARLALGRRWLHLLVGLLAVVAVSIPFVVYEFQTEWKDYPNFRYYSSLRSFVDLDALRWLVAISTGWMLPNDGVVPSPQRVLPQALIDIAADLALALLIVAVGAAAVAGVRSVRRRRATSMRLTALLLCITLPVVTSIRHWQPLFLHYYFASLPAVVLLIGFASSRGRVGKLFALPAALIVAAIQSFAGFRGLAYEASQVSPDPCFYTSIDAARSVASDVARFGHAASSSGAIIELDSGESKAMAYLLRADFADVHLPEPHIPSQTPTLVGNVGLGRTIPSALLEPESSPQLSVFTASAQPEARFGNGIAVHDVIFTAHSAFDQHVQVAFNWSVDPAAAAAQPIRWRIGLLDEAGHALQSDAGDMLVPSVVRGQKLVSWFSIDSRREVAPEQRAPGAYQLALELVDATAALEPAIRLPVEIGPLQRCDLPSTIP
jgi:4-amino-4-deoxy-L-arabinose transferase-like glycosyltransferase